MKKVKQELPWISSGDLRGVVTIQVRPFDIYCYVLSLLFLIKKVE